MESFEGSPGKIFPRFVLSPARAARGSLALAILIITNQIAREFVGAFFQISICCARVSRSHM